MSEEEKDTATQTAQDGAEQQTVNTAGDDGQQKTGTETVDAGQNNKEIEGLKAAAVAERQKRQEAEQKALQIEAQLNYQRQQLTQHPQQPQQYDPEDYVQNRQLQQFGQQIIQNMQLQTVRSTHQDLDTVIGSNAGTPAYQPSDTIKKIMMQNPSLYTGLDIQIMNGNPQAIGIAYDLAKRQAEMEELRTFKQAAQEQSQHQKVENQTTPTSPALAGGGGGVSFESQVPDAGTPEFDRLWEQVKAGAFDKRSK